MNAIVGPSQLTLPTDLKAAIEAQVVEAVTAAESLKSVADSIEIDGPEMAEIANNELRNMATLVKRLDERRFEITRPIDSMKSTVMDLFKRPGTILADAEAGLRTKVRDYLAAEKRRQQEAQRLAEEAAERERRAAAARQREAEERLAAAREQENETAVQEALAEEAAAAEAVEVAEVHAAPVVAEVKLAGTSTRSRWVVKSFDIQAMIEAAAKDPSLSIYLEVNEKRLRQYATMMGAEARVPGVVFDTEESLSVRRK